MAATEKVGIEVELLGGEEALALLKRIDGSIDTLNKKRKFKSLSGLKSAKGELESYISELQKLQKEEKKWQDLAKRVGKENMSAFGVREWDRVKGKIDETNGKIKQMSAEMDEVTIKTKTFGQMFKSAASSVAHVGSAMQSLGNAMVRLTSPFRRITSGLLMGAGYKALNLFTEGLSNVFTRSDTMKNYDRSLKALGLDTKETFKVFGEAKTAKENLDEAVQGLPTSLDEIMAAQKVYAGATGEMIESTKTAIAANNTFLASGMGAREQRFMQKYLVAMASGAELTTTQWQSMARIAPLAMRAVSQELGYASDEYAQFTKDVQSGTIAGKDFLKAFQKVGISGAVADAARVQTESWAGLSSNIRIAITRAGQGVIDTINETFKNATGRTLLQRLLGIDADGKKMGDGIKDWINGISDSIQNWVKSHPDELVDFFNDLKSIDWKGLAKGLAEGALEIGRLISAFAKWASGKDLSKIGKWLPRLNIFGNGLLVLGGFLKGTRHIWGLLGTLAFGKFQGKGGFFGKLVDIFGKKKDITTAGEVGGAITSASPKLISAFKNIALVSGILATPAITGFVITEATKRGIANFKESLNLLKDIEWTDAKKLLLGIGGFLGGSAILGGIIGNVPGGVKVGTGVAIGEVVAGVITSIATGFFALDMGFIRDGIKNFSEAVGYVHDAVVSINSIKELDNLGTLADKMGTIRDQMWQIKDVLEGKNGDKKDRGVVEKGMPTFSKDVADSLKNLADSTTNIQTAIDALNVLSRTGIAQNVVSKVGQVKTVLQDVAKMLNGGDGEEALPIIGEDKALSIKNLGEAMGHMKALVENLNILATMGLQQNIGSKLQQIKGAIRTVNSTFATMFNNTAGPANLNKNANNLADGIRGLRRVVWQLNALAGLEVDNDGVSAVVDQIKTALTELQGLSGLLELDIQVKLTSKFKTSVDTVVKQIGNGKKRIQDAMKKIPSAITKHISVTITASVNTRQAIAAITNGADTVKSIADSVTPAKGGLIYRSRGGGIPWKRRGTDTVPAMLTPGEYVHNKRAVNTFGIDFMRKVNNLDVKGAMNELMHRAGSMANVNRGTSIVNNYNNNQKVVINNNGNPSAGFTFKRASRFVGAI